MYFRYIEFLGEHNGSLQPNCSAENPNRPHASRVIGYTLALQDLRNVIDKSGHDGKEFSEHSNKRGGATLAANSGVPENEICEIGNWANVKTARKYIDQNTPLRQRRNLKLHRLI